MPSTPTRTQRDGSVSDSPSSQPSVGLPKRSRNAMAQARHRAKRKAYIEQLEENVIKLQSILDLSSEQMDKIPSPFVRVRELEQENELLLREVVDLRRQLAAKNPHPYPDLRDTCTLLPGGARSDREASHCRTGNTDGVYITSSPQDHSPPRSVPIPFVTGQFSHSFRASANPPYSSRLSGSSYSYGTSEPSLPPQAGTPSTMPSPMVSSSGYSPSSLPSYSHHGTLPPSYADNGLPPFSHIVSQYQSVKLEDRDMYYLSQHCS